MSHEYRSIIFETFPTSHPEYGHYIDVGGVYLDRNRMHIIANCYESNHIWSFTPDYADRILISLHDARELQKVISTSDWIYDSSQALDPSYIINGLKRGSILRVDIDSLKNELEMMKFLYME